MAADGHGGTLAIKVFQLRVLVPSHVILKKKKAMIMIREEGGKGYFFKKKSSQGKEQRTSFSSR